jgi:hypothetical protein
MQWNVTGWSCTGGSASTASNCVEICGDSKKVGMSFVMMGTQTVQTNVMSDCTGNVLGWDCKEEVHLLCLLVRQYAEMVLC